MSDNPGIPEEAVLRKRVLHAIGETLTSEGMVGYVLDQKLTDAALSALPHLRVQETEASKAHHCPTWEDPDGCRCNAATPRLQEIHKPFSDDGVLYCGWATGDRIVDGCGELYPCLYLRSTPNALALATSPAPPLALGCGICNGLPGNSGCSACQGTGRVSRFVPHPRPVVDREALGAALRPLLAKAYAAGMTRYNSGKINPPTEVQKLDTLTSDAADAVLALLPTEEGEGS